MDPRDLRAPTPPDRSGPGVALACGLLGLLAGALVVASLLSGAAPVPAPPGIPDPGPWTGWGLRLGDLAALVAGVLALGSLLVGAVLVDPGPDGRLGVEARRAARAAVAWASVCEVASVATAALVVADTRGVPLSRLLDAGPARLATDLAATGTARAHLLAAVAAALVGVLAARSRTRRTAAAAAAAMTIGLLPPVLAGHAGAVADQDVVATGLVVHVGAAAVWVGGLVGLLVHLRGQPAVRAGAVARFSVVAGAAYLALAVSGVAQVAVGLPTRGSWASGYGALVLAKAAILGLLGWCGHRHRRALRREVGHGATTAFVRLALAEVALMAVAGGLAAALSRTPLPAVPAAPSHGATHPGLPGVVDPVTLPRLLGEVRPNAVALVLVVGLWAAHRAGVRRVLAAGEAWPPERSRAATVAAVLAVAVLCSGLATYAPAMVSVQVLQLLLAMLVVPAVALRAAPDQLWRRVRSLQNGSGGPPVGAGADPVLGAVAVGGLLVLLYRTPLLELSQRSHWLHLLVLVAAAVAGAVHLAALRRDTADRLGGVGRVALAVPAVCLAVLGAQLLLGERLVAGRWFLELRWGWVDPVADQRLAGGVALVAAALLGGLVCARLLGSTATGAATGPATEAATGAVGPAVPDGAQRGGQSRSTTRPSSASAGTGP